MQLKAKLRNLATAKGINAQSLLHVFMMERFLERHSVSPYRSNFVLKGGLLITSWVGVAARTTRDIDMTVRSLPVSLADMRPVLDDITAIDAEDGVTLSIAHLAPVMERRQYPGIQVSGTARMESVTVPLKFDISTGDPVTPSAIDYKYDLMFENRAIRIQAYNFETVLAEKLESMADLGCDNTRMRDFYDVYMLVNIHGERIDLGLLRKALSATANRRGTLTNIKSIPAVLDQIAESSHFAALWQKYCTKNTYVATVSWSDVVSVVYDLASAISRQ